MTRIEKEKKIIIVGGGFGGIRCALDLVKKNLPRTKIILISDKTHFEYTPALYRVLTGRSPLEVCIPLRDIFNGKDIEILQDNIAQVNLQKKLLKGESGSSYVFDFLVLALGSETAYFNIPGLKELAFSFKSITDALRLKRHLHEIFKECETATLEQKVCAAHIVIVGGGATGAETAGELVLYTKNLAKKHRLPPGIVTIDLVEAAPRLLPSLPEDISTKIQKRLHSLGINIFLNRMVVKKEIEEVHLKDMELKTKTMVWTAGVKTNSLFSKIGELAFDKKGKVIVDEFLQPKSFENIFVIGDAAATPYSGLAQTAIADGVFVSDVIFHKINQKSLSPYIPKKTAHAIPVGPNWAAVLIGNFRIYGKIAWWLRRLADLRFFLSILSPKKAILAFQSGKTLCESCVICSPIEE